MLALVAVACVAALTSAAPADALSDRDTIIWGGFGDRPGQLFDPRGVAASPDGESVYVADTGNDRVQQFTAQGIFLRTWGGRGSGNGRFHDPVAVAVDRGGNVYVADSGNGRVQKFTGDGRFLAAWPAPFVVGIAIDRRSHVYILSSFFNLVAERTASGADVSAWPAFPVALAPEGAAERRWAVTAIATDLNGNVYVAAEHSTFFSTCNPGSNDNRENPVERVGTVRKFTAGGSQLAEGFTFSSPSDCYHGIIDRQVDGLAVNPANSNSYLAQTISDESLILDRALNGFPPDFRPARLGRPSYPTYASYPISSIDGLAFDCKGNLYASSRLSNRVVKYWVAGPQVTRCASRLGQPLRAGIELGAVKLAQVAGGSSRGLRAETTIGCRSGTCSGSVELRSLAPVLTLARSRFRIAGGDAETLVLHLTASGRRALLRKGRLRIRAIVHVRNRKQPVTGGVAALSRPTRLALACSAPSALGGALGASGSVAPAGARGAIDLGFSSMTGEVLRRTVRLDRRGRFTAAVLADASGGWEIEASYRGDSRHGPSAAGPCRTSVPPPPPPPKQPSTLSLSCPGVTPLDEPMTFSGAIDPRHVGFPVTITYTPPEASAITHTVNSDGAGRYSDTFTTNRAGTWRAQASWSGDSGHLGATSSACEVPVG